MDKYVKMETVISTMRWRGADTGLMKAVEEITGANVVPVRRGKWRDGYRIQKCSVCLYAGKKSWKWCPNCGARMEGGQDE